MGFVFLTRQAICQRAPRRSSCSPPSSRPSRATPASTPLLTKGVPSESFSAGPRSLAGRSLPIALLAGLRSPRSGRVVLFALPVAWLVGSAAGLLLAAQITLSVAETIVTIALGALLAADCPLQIAAVGGLAILLGLLQGSLNGSELPKTTSSGQISATGVAVALFVVVSLLAGQAASVRVPWARVAVRVAGSWIAAIGLSMLGWSMGVPS